MYDIILCFLTSFTLTYLAIPAIINVARKKNLVDEPNDRKSHQKGIPALGGIAIFAGVLFSIVLWTPFNYFGDLQYIICALIIIFLIGAKDDIDPIAPSKKFGGQIFAAFILVTKANIKLTSLYGIFGVYELPYIASLLLSMFTILVIINAFNLIDGINGLSASLSILISVTLGTWFFLTDQIELAMLAFALAGASLAFLKYNITPALIFMGDTGAMLIGIVCAGLSIEFIEIHQSLEGSPYAFSSAPAVAIGILILPLFDTLRVFVIRILQGKSPFYPDRSHIHHMLLDAGFTHMQATSILMVVNVIFIFVVVQLQNFGNLSLLTIILGMAIAFIFILNFAIQKKKKSA
ncbi:MAG: MraY family glycosyltransferase [Saprospiraceae bacterium]|nr:MraY family glycosyltransferase [Saprospiraceae bacterium]